MLGLITFVTTLYVTADDFCKTKLGPEPIRRGPKASLSRGEVVTLATLAQWYALRTERDAYGYIKRHLLPAFPTLPDRSQFNRLMRQHMAAIQHFGLNLATRAGASEAAYEIMDCTAAVTRNYGEAAFTL